MRDLYTEADWKRIHGQLLRRLVLLSCLAAVLIAVGIYSLTVRVQWLTIASVIATGAVLIFGIEVFCRPVYAYEKLIRSALQGRSHTENLIYDHQEPENSMVDGVLCRNLVFLGEPDKHGTRERLYYWDAQLPLPSFTQGKTFALKYTGKNIIGLAEDAA